MARPKRDGQLRKKITRTNITKKRSEPEIFIDKDSDFASIKISQGIEARSYEKDGIVFNEDSKGNIIEIQILNLSELAKKRVDPAA